MGIPAAHAKILPTMARDELQFVEWLRGRQESHPSVPIGIGDDMAMLQLASNRLLVSSDMLLDSVHFDLRRHTPAQAGRKAIACGLSDCAAMAVRPVAVTVSVAFPDAFSRADAESLYEGIFALASQFDVAVVGGDTTRWQHPLAIDVNVVAEPYEGITPVKRSGARAGDRLYVTGPLGGSATSHHLSFTPRVLESRSLASELGERLGAMIDITDGLSLDLWRMCKASGVGATLDEPLLQKIIRDEARRLSTTDGRSALDHALSDGEDFELLLAVHGEGEIGSVPLHPVGLVTASGFNIERAGGACEPLEPKGYVH